MSDGSIVEAKTVTCYNRKKWGEPMTGEIPIKVAYQCAYYTSIYKATQVYIPVLFRGSSEFQIYVYTPNYAFEKAIRERVTDFWENHILKQIPPQPLNYDDLLVLNPCISEDSSVGLGETVRDHFDRFVSLKAQIKELENEMEDHKFEIEKFMSDREFLLDEKGERIASFKYNTDSFRLDTAALKKNDPIIYNLYKKPSKPTRVFKLLNQGKKND
jgi:predicted phage-related endonuclease